jgi:hypothetical protein
MAFLAGRAGAGAGDLLRGDLRQVAGGRLPGAAEYRSDLDEGRDRDEARRSMRRWHGLRLARLLSRDFAFALGFALFV